MKTALLSNKPEVWITDFLGIGYRFHDVYMNVFPLFRDKMAAFRLWKKTIEWWPDDKIKLRFVEDGESYWFILYGGSDYKRDNTGFVKRVPVSQNYERFKVGYEKKATLRFGIYKGDPRGDKNYNLEILRRSKSIYDITFLQYSELVRESIEWQCTQENR
jgi:hypothetical protein